MLDMQFIRDHADIVKRAAEDKGIKVDVDQLIKLDDQRKAKQREFDDLRAAQNVASEKIAVAPVDQKQALIAEIKKATETIDEIKKQLGEIVSEHQKIMQLVPQIPSKDTPRGASDKENVEIERWGEQPVFDFTPKSHIELGEQNDWIDFERGTKLMGYRGYYLKGFAAQLEQAVLRFALDFMTKKGFVPVVPPILGHAPAFYGTGHFPFGQDEVFRVEHREGDQPLYLAGTAEIPLMSLHAGEILEEKELSKKYVGISPCYRTEVGSYGKDAKGLYRVRHFTKVEQIIIAPADSAKAHELFLEIAGYAKEILQALELPYRVLHVCTGDMGAGKVEMYDIETWMPSRQAYGETHSCSRLDDWQCRRLNIRYRDTAGELHYAYSLNNTVIATPRILIPLLECHQQVDRSVRIPAVLQPYF